MRRVRQPLVVGQLLGRRDRKARAVLKPIDVVRLDAVKTLFLAQFQAGFNEWLDDRQLADVKPFLFRPPRISFAQNRRRELGSVRSPALPRARIHVTDHMPALGMQRGHNGCFVFEQVDVIHLRIHRLVHGHRQLPLPGRVLRRDPPAGCRLGDLGRHEQERKAPAEPRPRCTSPPGGQRTRSTRRPHQPRKIPERTALAPAIRSTVIVTVPPAATLTGNDTHAPS